MSRRLIRILVILSVLSMIGILAVQAVWVRKAYALRDRQFRQSAFIALQEVADEVARMNRITQTKYDVTQLSADYFIVNTEAPIDPVTLEHLIQVSMRKHILITDFEYGIYNCESDRMVYGAYVGTSAARMPVRSTLPKFDRFTYYFVIRFPQQAIFAVGQLEGWLWSTGAVVLLVLVFGYNLSVVLQQRRLTEVQQDFINNITHELQTPVSTIRIAADVLAQDNIRHQPDRWRQYTRILNEESQRLQRQINNVLQLSQSQHTGFTLSRTDVDVHELLTSTATTVGDSVHLDLQATNAHLKADRYHLENVLNNLIDNALKYRKTSPDAPPPEVWLRTRPVNGQLEWSVEDNGIGIAPEHRKAIFKQFFRVPTGKVHDTKGFGLGLYYVQQVVRAHGWKISLESQLGQGSKFTICAPLFSTSKMT
ncbi:MAG: HAMP domain-containing histidine kinase [Rudanella sp.]|nr:HAMP domain-containing histidine kinase [Rudanella sp.]